MGTGLALRLFRVGESKGPAATLYPASTVGAVISHCLRSTGWASCASCRLLRDIRDKLQADITSLETFSKYNDTIERASVGLALQLQNVWLAWIDEFLAARFDTAP